MLGVEEPSELGGRVDVLFGDDGIVLIEVGGVLAEALGELEGVEPHELAAHGEVEDGGACGEDLVDGFRGESGGVDPVAQPLGGSDVDSVDARVSEDRNQVFVEVNAPVEDASGGVGALSGEPILADFGEAGEASRVDETAVVALGFRVAFEAFGLGEAAGAVKASH